MSKIESFTFTSEVARQSVVVQSDKEQMVLCKGAPEVVASLCSPDTLPENFSNELSNISNGTRVLAMAYKKLKLDKSELTREECEKDLTFAGFLIFKNNLKQDSREVIAELSAAKIKSIMVTGDGLETAIGIGREVGMLHSNEFQKPFIENGELKWHALKSAQLSPTTNQSNSQMNDDPIVMTGDDFNWIKAHKGHLGRVFISYLKILNPGGLSTVDIARYYIISFALLDLTPSKLL